MTTDTAMSTEVHVEGVGPVTVVTDVAVVSQGGPWWWETTYLWGPDRTFVPIMTTTEEAARDAHQAFSHPLVIACVMAPVL